jgi:predicted DNA-binding protein
MPTFTMRLPDEDYEDLQAMALLTGQSMAELVRDAVSASLTNFASNKLDQRYTEELKARNLAFEKLKKRLKAGRREAADNSPDPELAGGRRMAAAT